nr:MAG TPA: hypothetical protein [Caudoviricetes sp.]
MRYVHAYSKTAATIYNLAAAASVTNGVLGLLVACYEHNLAAGLLALGTAVLGREERPGGEAE